MCCDCTFNHLEAQQRPISNQALTGESRHPHSWCISGVQGVTAVKSELLLIWSLSQSHTRPTRVRSSKQESIKSLNQTKDNFFQPNRGVDYTSHSSVQTCKQGCGGFFLMQFRADKGNVHLTYNAGRRLWISQL